MAADWTPEKSRVHEYGRMSERYLRLMGAASLATAGVSEIATNTPTLYNVAIGAIGAVSYGAGQYVKHGLDRVERNFKERRSQ